MGAQSPDARSRTERRGRCRLMRVFAHVMKKGPGATQLAAGAGPSIWGDGHVLQHRRRAASGFLTGAPPLPSTSNTLASNISAQSADSPMAALPRFKRSCCFPDRCRP